VYKTQDRL